MKTTMRSNVIVVLVLAILLITNVFVIGSDFMSFNAQIVYVDDNAGAGWYDATHVKTIQEGVDNVSSGGTVYVWAGTYNENVIVNKALTIQGNSSTNTTINGGNTENTVNITVDWVNLTGFCITNCVISGAENQYAGVRVIGNNTHIYSCNISNNNGHGVCVGVDGSDYHLNNISNSNISSNGEIGVFLLNTYNNSVYNNTVISYVNDRGIFLEGDFSVNYFNNISYNLIERSDFGIEIEGANHSIWNNTVLNNTCNGIYLSGAENVTVYNNNVTSNGGYVAGDNYFGLKLEGSNNNTFYNNYVSNINNSITYNVNETYCTYGNVWNTTKQSGSSIIGGTYLGGNYWSDYAGTDTDGDGLGNTLTPYNSSCNITNGGDYLPLCNAQTATVKNVNTSEMFVTIQSAIDDSDTLNGHTIQVWDGNYNESVTVSKSLTIIGNSTETVNLTYLGIDDGAIIISADWVNISGIKIHNTSGNAMFLAWTNHTNISSLLFVDIEDSVIEPAGKSMSAIELYNLTVRNAGNGIGLQMTHNLSIINCNIINVTRFGVGEDSGSLYLTNIIDAIITGCNISDSSTETSWGIFLDEGNTNITIYNNYISNFTILAYDKFGNASWNISKQLGTNIIGGQYLGGNYWSDYAGYDTDNDGLGNTLTPYNSSGNITNGGDYLPLCTAQEGIVADVSPDVWDAGNINLGDYTTTNFTFYQNGSVNLDITIGYNSTNYTFVVYNDWLTLGHDRFCANFTNNTWASEHDILVGYPSSSNLKQNFPPGNFEFGVRMWMPRTTTSYPSKQEDFDIVLTVQEHT